MKDGKICFAVIVGTRSFFNTELAINGKKNILKTLDSLGFATVIMPKEATPTGCVETTEDGIICGEYFKKFADEIDGIIVTLPNFGLGRKVLLKFCENISFCENTSFCEILFELAYCNVAPFNKILSVFISSNVSLLNNVLFNDVLLYNVLLLYDAQFCST